MAGFNEETLARSLKSIIPATESIGVDNATTRSESRVRVLAIIIAMPQDINEDGIIRTFISIHSSHVRLRTSAITEVEELCVAFTSENVSKGASKVACWGIRVTSREENSDLFTITRGWRRWGWRRWGWTTSIINCQVITVDICVAVIGSIADKA
jgi:hypothetical protein